MAQTSGDQTKEGAKPVEDQSNQINPAATTASTTATSTATTTSTATVHDPDQDKDFDPTAEALIDEIDDERTLEEEEALACADSAAVQNEIDDLKRESEMPIEELLAYYERMRNEEAAMAAANGGEDEEFEEDDEEDFEDDDEDDDEDSDEVRKKRRLGKSVSDSDTANNGSQTDQRLAPVAEQLISRSASQQMQSTQSLQAQPHHLSNSHVLSPQQNQSLDVNLSNNNPEQQSDIVDPSGRQTQVQCEDSAYLGSDNTATTTPTSIPPTSEDNPTNNHHDSHHNRKSSNYPHHEPRHPIDVANTISSTTPRAHRHSMTEFLVDSDTAASGIFKTLLDYDLDDSDDMDEDYSYTDDENAEDEREWRRVIHVGPEYQADVPDGLSEYESDLPPYENQDTLVWRCNAEQDSKQLLEYLKQASMIGKRTDISLSPASVPKISDSNLRLYRERMQDSGSAVSTTLNSMERYHENINTGNENPPPPENLQQQQDVYMSQSRKRLRIDSELEQENAQDEIVQPSGDLPTVNNLVTVAKDDNSNSISQDNRPELSTEDYYQGAEQLLYLLLQCNHNFEEAIRRRKLDPFKYYLSEPMSLWSQDECLGFEHGLRAYGKNFRLIRNVKVPTRTRAEVVTFYYLWKKSERHDVYTNQYKLDRKRCLTHPGTTDYMDKFIEDNESALNASSTPTPINSPAELHQISHISNSTVNHPISICNTSTGLGTTRLDHLGISRELSIKQTCNELDHRGNDQSNPPQSNSLQLGNDSIG